MATGGGAEEERKRGRLQLLGPARPSTRAEEAEGGREKMGWEIGRASCRERVFWIV